MSNDMYNRLSFRSPLRRTRNYKDKDIPQTPVKCATIPVKIPVQIPVKSESTKPQVRQKSSMYDRISCRSPKKIVPKIDDSYKVVTKTPSGATVKVPEPVNKKFSFVKFIEKKIPTPIKQEVVTEYIKPLNKKYNFNDALLIYENNQTFYLEQIINQTEPLENILKNVKILEQWFCKMNEPKPSMEEDVEDWIERCEWKKTHGYSKYFDLNLLSYTDY